MTIRIRSIAITAVLFCGIALTSCGAGSPDDGAANGQSGLVLQANTTQLMNWILDVQADIVWAAGGTIITEQGEQQMIPETDDEWNALRNAAATVAEATNLLLLPPHKRDDHDWVAMTRKVVEKANDCVVAAEAKDIDALFTAGSDMYLACTACHAKYVIGEPMPPEDLPK
jgi:hypothetical protein